jgi:hypothetical protein
MGTEQSEAYKNAINEYRAACQARSAKSSDGISNNIAGLIPKRQISNYFTQFRKVSISYDAEFEKYVYGYLQRLSHCSTDCESPFAYKVYLW